MRGEIYAACLEIIGQAAEMGICAENEAWHMSPEELGRCFRAWEDMNVRRMKDMDMLAWLIGQYTAVGINSPGRYPMQPDRVRERAAGDERMRQLMKNMAAGCGKEAEHE